MDEKGPSGDHHLLWEKSPGRDSQTVFPQTSVPTALNT